MLDGAVPVQSLDAVYQRSIVQVSRSSRTGELFGENGLNIFGICRANASSTEEVLFESRSRCIDDRKEEFQDLLALRRLKGLQQQVKTKRPFRVPGSQWLAALFGGELVLELC